MITKMNIIIFILMTLMIAGCTSVITDEVRSMVDDTAGIDEVLNRPEKYLGSTVLWAGIIINTKNFGNHTVIEVLQKPADYQGRPKDVDISNGRFLARTEDFLDPAIYSIGREITVAGKVLGHDTAPVGDYNYTYPVISITELYLWPAEPEAIYNYYYYPSYFHHQWKYW
jgi:outer membrane lipoprotein